MHTAQEYIDYGISTREDGVYLHSEATHDIGNIAIGLKQDSTAQCMNTLKWMHCTGANAVHGKK